MATAKRPRTYAELYAFFRERAEASPDAPERRSRMARLFDQPLEYGLEARYWANTRGEPRQIRSYGTNCGFEIYHPETLYHGGYEWLAPVNSVSFATTGGDGCHFSFITSPDGKWSEQSPIVLIIPGACHENGVVIVGADLWDFLSFGLRTGYFVLENLAWRFDEFLANYPDRDPVAGTDDVEQTELAALAEIFGLKGWEQDSIRPRLAQLRAQHYPQLAFTPE